MFFSRPIRIVSRPKLTGAGEHWGVHLPDGRVAHNGMGHNVKITSYEEFAQGQPIKVIREVANSQKENVYANLRLAFAHPREYHVTEWNCEQFANWLVGVKPESPQVRGWTILTLGAAVLVLVAAAAR